jgi:hypothetical protein
VNTSIIPYEQTIQAATKLVERTLATGGATVGQYGADAPDEGFAVGSAFNTPTLKISRDTQIDDAIALVAVWMTPKPSNIEWFGGWIDGDTLYVDAVTIFPNTPKGRVKALLAGRERGEIAIYDLAKRETITL